MGEGGAVISLTFDFILTEEFVKLEERTNLATHIRLLFLAQLFFAFAFRLQFSDQFKMILLALSPFASLASMALKSLRSPPGREKHYKGGVRKIKMEI